jgi:hypothetical protein
MSWDIHKSGIQNASYAGLIGLVAFKGNFTAVVIYDCH